MSDPSNPILVITVLDAVQFCNAKDYTDSMAEAMLASLERGITLRDMFAAAIAPSVSFDHHDVKGSYEGWAREVYYRANALLAARQEKK